jgi:hypothetical protein
MTFEERFAKSDIPVGFKPIAQSGWNWALIELAAERERHEDKEMTFEQSQELADLVGKIIKLAHNLDEEWAAEQITELLAAERRHEAEVKGLVAKWREAASDGDGLITDPDLLEMADELEALLRPHETGAEDGKA